MNNLDSSTDAVVAEMFAKARQAWELGDKRASSILLNQILKRNITHPGAWELLYNQLGSGKAFDDFQREFVQKYYPDRLPLLSPQTSPLSLQEQRVNQPATPGAEPPAEMPVDSGAQGSIHASSTVDTVQNLVPAPRAGSSGYVPAPAAGRPSQWTQISNYYLDHKGLVYLIGASAIVLLCLVAGVLLLKQLFGKSNGSTADLPEGLTTGVWVASDAAGSPMGGGLFGFSRDNIGYWGTSPMTYHKTSATTMEFCFVIIRGDQGENVCGTLTVTDIINNQSVVVSVSGKYISDSIKATMRKRFEDTSSGNLKKDIIGTWVYEEDLSDLIECSDTGVVCEMVFGKNQQVADSQRGSLSYVIAGDKITMFGETFIVSDYGNIMFLTVENSGNSPRGITLKRK